VLALGLEIDKEAIVTIKIKEMELVNESSN
jgi:hypothetical protein